jgi:hypothetical protein
VERAFGYGALAGLALLVLSIPVGIATNLVTGGLQSPFFLAPLGLGALLTSVGWILWGSWSATLDRYDVPLNTTAKLTLAATTILVLGVVCLLAAGAPLVVYTESDPPDSLFPVVIGLGGLGAFLIAATIAGSAVYGGIALGGPRWWWPGALLTVGLPAAVTGVVLETTPLTVLGVLALVGSVIGYRGARKSGLEQGREDAVEAENHRRRHGLR